MTGGRIVSQRYPVRFEPAAEGGYVTTFSDIASVITQADGLEEPEGPSAGSLAPHC